MKNSPKRCLVSQPFRKMTDKQIERWKTYKYGGSDVYQALFPKTNTDLAIMAVEAYCGNVEEQTPLFTHMFEQMIEYDHFPSLSIPKKLNRNQAIKILARVCKAWLVEYVYHSQFCRFQIPEDNYFLEGDDD